MSLVSFAALSVPSRVACSVAIWLVGTSAETIRPTRAHDIP